MQILPKILIGTSIVAVVTVACAFAYPALAQGTNGIQLVSMMNQQCPTGYNRGKQRDEQGNLVAGDPQLCYPASDNPPSVYQAISSGGTCVAPYVRDTQSDWCTNRAPQKSK